MSFLAYFGAICALVAVGPPAIIAMLEGHFGLSALAVAVAITVLWWMPPP